MNSYRLENDTFVIENFDSKAPFCSFLPGLTGEKGIPIWSFYVNRGQCITSFGIDNKHKPIMEFFPANVAYENTAVKGFRTLVRKNGEYFEPFFINKSKNVKRDLYIKQNSFKIVETNNDMNFKTTVEYFILPDESFGALVRSVRFENLGEKADFEILDGMPRIIPSGVGGPEFQRMANLMRSYNNISNLENKIPLIFNPISGDDDSEVKTVSGGFFYMTFDKNGLVCPVYDPSAIFGEETSMIYPVNFAENGLDFVSSYNQHGTNKICGCFTPAKVTLDKGEVYEIAALCGYTHSAEFINKKAKTVANLNYVADKLVRADELSVKFTDDVATSSGSPLMDMYFRQCYLDNFLRGGYPFIFKGDKNKIVHLFSRKHGDPERDYNYFSIAGEYYSQGDGNFRDVLQNRRNDVLFHPEVEDFDIEMFFSFMQFNGYNPLFVKGTTFTVINEKKTELEKVVEECVIDKKDVVEKILEKSFTAGSLINGIYNNGVKLCVSDDEFLEKILKCCEQNFEASTDKYGNWSDHWDYLMDLIDCYLKVYPDRLKELLFDNCNYKYFDSDVFITPRDEKYYFNGEEARQFDSFIVDEDKYERGYIKDGTNWLKDKNGNIYKTNLVEKLISLCVNKFALLDPCQMGIEMEANRAGWCDATNGLTSMFGSGMSETFELLRLCEFVFEILNKFADEKIKLPTELYDFYNKVNSCVDNYKSEFEYWDSVATARENFREITRYEISGETVETELKSFISSFEKYIDMIKKGIDKAIEFGGGFCPTYIKYRADEFEIIKENGNGYPNVRVKKFTPVLVSKFLEGPAKQIRECKDSKKALEILEEVKSSDVYDKKLKMYKTSENISKEGYEFGRIAAFTPGWQENESIFLHMEYKFLLGILKSGNYEAFYKELQNVFIPFQNPEVYGRSILENCSFLASSANPDENLHGRGFVSRLSGSTTEVISIWTEMFLGKTPFVYENGKLGLKLKPMLESFMFDDNGEVSFNFLTENRVTVHNPSKDATYNKDVKYVVVDGERFDGDTVWGETAEKVRTDKNLEIHIYY